MKKTSGSLLARSAHILWMTAATSAVALAQVAPFETVTTLSTEVVPIESEFDVPQTGAGQYRITVTDIGALLTVPAAAPLDSVNVLVTRGKTVVASLDGTVDPLPVDTATFDGTPGSYAVHVVGKPGGEPGSGPITLKIENVASGTAVLSLSGTLSPPETVKADVRSYQAEIDVPADGDYELTVADLGFPRALETAGAFLFKDGASSLTACLSLPEVPNVCPATKTVALTAGKYQVVAAGATPAGSDAGAFSVHFSAVGGGPVIHSRSVEIGNIRRVSPFSFQLDAGTHTLRLRDLEFPIVLASSGAIVTRAAQIAAHADAAAPEKTFAVANNDTAYDVFSYASPDLGEGAGSYVVDLRPGDAAPVLSSVEAVGSTTGTPVAYTFPADVTVAGNYRARLGDFQFPAALSAARLALVQNAAVVAKTDAANPGPTLSLDVSNLATGRVTAIAIVRPASVGGTVQQSGGTFGIELTSNPGNQTGSQMILDATQGVGGLISVRKVSILQAGKYDLTISDLDLPEAFRDLMAVVSRGSQKLGIVLVGSGGSSPQGGSETLMDFEAAVGNYSVTLVSQPAAPLNAGTYAVTFAQAPAGPTVTLDADPKAVASGSTTKLTWSSQSATSCTASSNPTGVWSGTKAVASNENSGPITAATTFTLRCTGAGGRTSEQSVSVGVSSQAGGGGDGGGGAFGWFGLIGLASCLALARRASVPRKPAGIAHSYY